MSMADISKEDLRKEIDGILEGADLDTLSSKKVRQQLEEKLKFDLSDRKKEIDEMVMEAVEKKPHIEDETSMKTKEGDKANISREPVANKKKAAKLDQSIDEDEENSESEGDEDEEDEDEYKPNEEDFSKRKPARQQERRQPMRKGTSETPETKIKPRPARSAAEDKKSKTLITKSSDSEGKSAESEESEEESDDAPVPVPKKTPAPRGRKPQSKPTPVEEDSEDSDEASKKKLPKKQQQESGSEYEEFDEENSDSSDEGSDESYSPGKKSSGKKRGRLGGRGGGKKKRADSSDAEDSDEDWKTATKKKRSIPAKKGESSPVAKAKSAKGGVKAVKLSPELSDIMGTESMPRPEVVKKMWSIIKERNLYDPKNKQFAVCDEQLQKVFGVKRFRTFGMMKYLKAHFID